MSGWGEGSALILFLILIAQVSSCVHEEEQADALERIADHLVKQ